MNVGELVIVIKPRSGREIHRNRIGKLVSIVSNWNSVKFGDGNEIKFFANELEIVTTPTAQSYEKINFTNKCIKIPRTLSRARRPPLR